MTNIKQIREELDTFSDLITVDKARQLIEAAYRYGYHYGYYLCADNQGVLDVDIEHPNDIPDENP